MRPQLAGELTLCVTGLLEVRELGDISSTRWMAGREISQDLVWSEQLVFDLAGSRAPTAPGTDVPGACDSKARNNRAVAPAVNRPDRCASLAQGAGARSAPR